MASASRQGYPLLGREAGGEAASPLLLSQNNFASVAAPLQGQRGGDHCEIKELAGLVSLQTSEEPSYSANWGNKNPPTGETRTSQLRK